MADQPTPTVLGVPLNRVVAFGGPYIAIASGAVADWLLVHVHFLALFHTTHTQLASAVTQVAVFATTAVLVWLGHQKWLEGWQVWSYGKHTVAPLDLSGPVVSPPSGDYDPNEFGDTGADPVQPPGLK